MNEIILPEGWPRPSGYAHAIVATGRIIALAGQVGWNPQTEKIETDDFVEQAEQALRNVLAVLDAASARVQDVVRLNWYITDRDAFVSNRESLGRVYRSVFGKHFPAMTVVVVAGLIEPRALLEIEVTAVLSALR